MTNPLQSNIAPQLTLLNRDIKPFLMVFIVRIGKQFMVNSIHQTFTRCKMRFQAPCYYCYYYYYYYYYYICRSAFQRICIYTDTVYHNCT